MNCVDLKISPPRFRPVLWIMVIGVTSLQAAPLSLEQAHDNAEHILKELNTSERTTTQILTLLEEALLKKADLTQDIIMVDDAMVQTELTHIMNKYGIDEARIRKNIAEEKKRLQMIEDENLARQLQAEEINATQFETEKRLRNQKEAEKKGTRLSAIKADEEYARKLEEEDNRLAHIERQLHAEEHRRLQERREEEHNKAQKMAQEERDRLETLKADEAYARKLQEEEDRAHRRRPSLTERHRQAAQEKFALKEEKIAEEKRRRQEARERLMKRREAEKKKRLEEEKRMRHEQEERLRHADRERQIREDEELAHRLQAEENSPSAIPSDPTLIPAEKSVRQHAIPDSIQYLDIKTPLQPSGIPLHVLGVRPQLNNTCGYHTACNLSVIQGLIETRRPVAGNVLHDNLLANEIIRTQRMLEDWEVLEVTQDPRVRLNNFMILGSEMERGGQGVTPYPYIPLRPGEELSEAQFNERINDQIAYFATIKTSKNIVANLALNLDNIHWVGLSIVKKDGILTLYYVDSLNRGLSKGSRAYDLIEYVVKQLV